jgi:hypothetical protein
MVSECLLVSEEFVWDNAHLPRPAKILPIGQDALRRDCPLGKTGLLTKLEPHPGQVNSEELSDFYFSALRNK